MAIQYNSVTVNYGLSEKMLVLQAKNPSPELSFWTVNSCGKSRQVLLVMTEYGVVLLRSRCPGPLQVTDDGVISPSTQAGMY